ncbi:MAG: dihydroorotate dehydrogenase [candidate division Zixibacteria bacterium]|nr:dihydroorotate dehydrogenase [candidate division Zixibacteria bacterium]
MLDLSVTIAGKKFKNPIWLASGTCGYGEELAEFFDISQLGAIVTKTITLKPRKGHPSPRVCETTSGMLNAIGLQNVGVDEFLKSKLPFLKNKKASVIVNAAGYSVSDYCAVCEKLNLHSEFIRLIELNMSCPNVSDGMEFSKDPAMAETLIKEAKKVTGIPLIAKLSPNVSNIGDIADAVEQGGADAVSLINTLVGMAVNIESFKPRISNITGGLSGPAIKPVALAMVYQVHRRIRIPIIGIGGISNHKDVIEFILCGASAVQIGTANFGNPLTAMDVIEDLSGWLGEKGYDSTSQLVGKIKDK